MPQSPSNLQIDIPKIDKVRVTAFQDRIMDWFRRNKRKFPWREPERSPYEILIAEIMLQKTKAENIVDTYLNFIKKYPDFQALSRARLGELSNILKVLGLSNVRSKSIFRLTKEIVMLGKIPRERETLLKLPGIGPYIANAFLVSAHDRRLAVVDTNVRRLYKRLFSFESCRDPRRDKRIWIFAERMLPSNSCKEFTWSLMDFCASICKAKDPLCPSCPLNDICDYGEEVLAEKK